MLSGIKLVDAHCHAVVSRPMDRDSFGQAATEADVGAPPGVSYLDGAVGLAIRRWCAPVLGLDAGVSIDDYLERRQQLGVEEVSRTLLRAAGLSHLLVDTGLNGADLTRIDELGDLAGADAREVVRLETVAELLVSRGTNAGEFESAYREALSKATDNAVAVKSILAYRCGFDVDLGRPTSAEVREAAVRWLDSEKPGRLDEPALLSFVLWCGVDAGLPIQVHTGFGDRDLALVNSNPGLLQPFLSAVEPRGVPVILLHCYPYQREAGWLAQVYPNVYVDIGLTVAQVGARADSVLGEFLELAPFGKVLFSTDAFALPELYLVGAAQFRRSLEKLLGGWVADGAMQTVEAERLAVGIGSANAKRLYALS